MAVLAVAISTSLFAQTTFRLGNEFHVNDATGAAESEAAVARAADGQFVVVWTQSRGGNDTDVIARRFDSLGVPLGPSFQINNFTPFVQNAPVVAMDSSHRFVVAWSSASVAYGAPDVFLRRFDSAGVAQGVELQLNAFTLGSQRAGAIASDAAGDFVIAWQGHLQDGDGYGVFGRRFAASGAALGGELQINLATVGNQAFPSLDAEPDGDFVVVWHGAESGRIFGRRFTSAGVGGTEMTISAYTEAGQVFPAVALDGAGNFVVTWYEGTQHDGHGGSIFGRRFNALGLAEGVEFQVNSYTMYTQRIPALDVKGNGSFVVAWESNQQDGANYGIFARTFDSTGAPRGPELQVNTYTPSSQARARVAMDSDGDFVVVWYSYFQNAGVAGVYAQRYATLVALDVDGNGVFQALTDGLLVLRFGFGFTGQTLITGAVGAGCTRCDAASILAYLQTMI